MIDARVELAWERFIGEMERRFPSSAWPQEELRVKRNGLAALAEREASEDHYENAAELRAEARDLGACLFSRGDTAMRVAAEELRLDMARVIVGEGPQPRIVSSRDPDTLERVDAVLDDPDVNLATLACWTHAGRYALPYALTDWDKLELGMAVKHIAWEPEPVSPAAPAADAGREVEQLAAQPRNELDIDLG